MSTTNAIHTKAMLVWLNIRTWTARKYDKRVTAEVNTSKDAASDAGRYNKLLLPGDSSAFKAVLTLAGAIRQRHYHETLSWSDEGWRLLPTANFMTYADWFRGQQSAFTSAVGEFESAYPALRDAARVSLNGMYRDEDYPSVLDIRHKFAMDVQYAPLPVQGDFRVDLSDQVIAEIESTVQDRVTRATDVAMKDAWQRLYDSVSRMAERLAQPDAVFRNSLVGNVREVCEVLSRLNVTGDANLESMRQRVMAELSSHTPEALRENPHVRQNAASKAVDIMNAMKGVYGDLS